MVMELANCQLQERFRMCKAKGLPGIPRDELLGYLEEAAESLDMIGARYGLQHLDVKPENLFLVAGHAKVGDYGLVRRAQRAKTNDDDNRGFTPRYTAPEVLLGRVDTRSDQYSLALVYAELLTGCFPYPGRTPQQLVFEHLHTAPNLSALPASDRNIVARALSKQPADRFLSCSEFMKALVHASSLVDLQAALPPGEPPIQDTPRPAGGDTTHVQGISNLFSRAQTTRDEEPAAATLATRGHAVNTSLRATNSRVIATRRNESTPPVDPFAGLEPVMPVNVLLGMLPRGANPPSMSSDTFVEHVYNTALADRPLDTLADGRTEGVLTSRFLCTLPAAMVPLKLTIMTEALGPGGTETRPIPDRPVA